MSPNSAYQRHTPGRVPFATSFSWQSPPPLLTAIQALANLCQDYDHHRSLDDHLLQAVQRRQAQAWLEPEHRAYVQLGQQQLEILVHPHWRGLGWGTWLLQHMISQQSQLSIWAYGDNEKTVAWLHRYGFLTHRVLSQMQFAGPAPPPPQWPENFLIRRFQENYAPAWHQLHLSLQTDPQRAWSWQRLQQELQMTSTENFWLLFKKDFLCGYLWLKHSEIFMWALNPKMRGRGLGSKLLQWGMSQSQNTWGFCDQASTLKIYQSQGFTEVGRDRCLQRYQ